MFAVVLRSEDGESLTLATTPDDITDIVAEVADSSPQVTGHAEALSIRDLIVGEAVDVGLDVTFQPVPESAATFGELAVVNSESEFSYWLHSCAEFKKGGSVADVPRDWHGRWTKGPDSGPGFFGDVGVDSVKGAVELMHPGTVLELDDKGDHWELSRLVVPKDQRGQGKGGDVMRTITASADLAGMPITLTPETIDGGSKKRLESFYKDHGFVKNKGRYKLWSSRDSMIRYPGMHASAELYLTARLDEFRQVPRDYQGRWCKGSGCQVVPLTNESTIADLKAGPVSAAQAAEARALLSEAIGLAGTDLDARAEVLTGLDHLGSAATVAQHDRLLTPSGYTAERDELHKEIVDQFFAENAHVPLDGKAVLAGGLPGAGKSTALGKDDVGIDKSQYMHVDPDNFKQQLLDRNAIDLVPGMTGGEHAALLHEESGHIVDLITARATGERRNIILDKTMAKPLDLELAELHKGGYSVTGVFVDLPVSESHYSARERWVRGGRFIPPKIIEGQRGEGDKSKNVDVFKSMSSNFEEWIYVDNTGLGTPEMNPRGTVRRGSGRVTNEFAGSRMVVFRTRGDTARDYHGRWTKGAPGAVDPGLAGSYADKLADGQSITVAPGMAVPVLENLGQRAEPVDLTRMSIEGHSNLYGDVASNQLSRVEMPQIPTAKLDGFGDYLAERGVSTKVRKVDPASLRATQNELDGRKVGQMTTALRTGTMVGAEHPLWISSDGMLLDGHHRWAAESALSVGEKPRKVTVVQASVPMSQLLGMARTYGHGEGIDTKRHGMSVSRRVAQFRSAADTTARDYHGRWTKAGGGTGSGVGMPTGADFDKMERVGGPLGSNGGQWYRDEDGTKYLVKPAGSQTHAHNELAAGLTYEHLGVPVNNTGAFEKDGQWYVSKRAVEGHTVGMDPTPDIQMQARQGYHADVLTSSWDTFGLSGDNTLIGDDGQVYRIDVGGSNMFRAMGGNKDSFNPGREWVEPTSMRTSNQGRKLYGNFGDKEAAVHLSKLQDVNLDALDLTFRSAGISDEVRVRTIATYRDRIQNQLPGILAKMRR